MTTASPRAAGNSGGAVAADCVRVETAESHVAGRPWILAIAGGQGALVLTVGEAADLARLLTIVADQELRPTTAPVADPADRVEGAARTGDIAGAVGGRAMTARDADRARRDTSPAGAVARGTLTRSSRVAGRTDTRHPDAP